MWVISVYSCIYIAGRNSNLSPRSIARTRSVITVSLSRRFAAMASMAPLRVLLLSLASVVVVTGQTTLQPSPNGCSDRPPGQTGWTCGNRGCTCRELAASGLCNHETHSTGTMRVCCLTCNGPYPGVSTPILPVLVAADRKSIVLLFLMNPLPPISHGGKA